MTVCVLDVDYGPGSVALELVKHASEGRTVGVDISLTFLSKARDAFECRIS